MDNEAEVFLNSVPLLASLSREERQQLVQALVEQVYEQEAWVIQQVSINAPLGLCLSRQVFNKTEIDALSR